MISSFFVPGFFETSTLLALRAENRNGTVHIDRRLEGVQVLQGIEERDLFGLLVALGIFLDQLVEASGLFVTGSIVEAVKLLKPGVPEGADLSELDSGGVAFCAPRQRAEARGPHAEAFAGEGFDRVSDPLLQSNDRVCAVDHPNVILCSASRQLRAFPSPAIEIQAHGCASKAICEENWAALPGADRTGSYVHARRGNKMDIHRPVGTQRRIQSSNHVVQANLYPNPETLDIEGAILQDFVGVEAKLSFHEVSR
mmetsp:Transcript_23465/g.41935  ORF Transcript_23465/g.41935 Transcript_23465/m.41935 type:complete len:255 (-) Transcript_23465:191-955(-)